MLTHDLLKVLEDYGYMVQRFEVRMVPVGEPGAGQGFVLKMKLRAEKRL